VSVVKPKAAFYIFPRLDIEKFGIVDDEQFALDFLREKKVLVTCGTGFNWQTPDHFRIVFLPNMEVLKESVERLADFLETYHQR
jgi:alanine-synthesizing transaminase